tara:strand:+ start:356 stop:1549 length:1194 start_codon:yes stop_codon:yes gene_type:complete
MGFGPLGVKEAVEMSKPKVKGTNNERNDNVKFGSVDLNSGRTLDNKKQTARRTRSAGEIPGVKMKMGYPLARGPSNDTGDNLLIKCIQYVNPSIGLDSEREFVYSKVDGVNPLTEKKVNAGDRIADGKGSFLTQPIKGTTRLKNQGAVDRQKNQKAIYYIQLPIPQDVNDSNVVTWGEDNMNIFQLAGVAAASEVMRNPLQSFKAAKEVFADADNLLGGIDEVAQRAISAAIAGRAIDALGGNVRPNSVLGRSAGVILNSNLELLFGGVNLRTFPFSINFSPRTEEESKEVLLIIKALKSSMAAKKNADVGGQGGIFLRAPDVFQLRYIHKGSDHPFLNSIKDCALTGMNVNYTNSGTYATYHTGVPVSIQMNLTFKELNPLYFEDYTDPGLPGVGY